MPIPKSQLETWSKYHQLDVLKATYDNIQTALSGFNLPDNHKSNQYLQGSYGNSTHIYGKGDIDVVVELNSSFSSNLSLLGKSSLSNSVYSLQQFFSDLSTYLQNYYGYEYVEAGSKTIKIKYKDGKKAVDIVACNEYRHYIDPNNSNSKYATGIILNNKTINYPKIHKSNGEIKMNDTNKMFKSYIRILKNINKKLKNDKLSSYNLVPSYFIECFLYNLPNYLFNSDLQLGFVSILNWCIEKSNEPSGFNDFICQNGRQNLFGIDKTQWTIIGCESFLNQVIKLNDNWL